MFELQDMGPKLNYIVLPLLFIVPAVLVYIVILLAKLPGKIAAQRAHCHASAVNICGWLGLLTGISWPIALVWAYLDPPDDRLPQIAASPDQLTALAGKLQSMTHSIDAIESKLERQLK